MLLERVSTVIVQNNHNWHIKCIADMLNQNESYKTRFLTWMIKHCNFSARDASSKIQYNGIPILPSLVINQPYDVHCWTTPVSHRNTLKIMHLHQWHIRPTHRSSYIVVPIHSEKFATEFENKYVQQTDEKEEEE
jgi:hypothetical protein